MTAHNISHSFWFHLKMHAHMVHDAHILKIYKSFSMFLHMYVHLCVRPPVHSFALFIRPFYNRHTLNTLRIHELKAFYRYKWHRMKSQRIRNVSYCISSRYVCVCMVGGVWVCLCNVHTCEYAMHHQLYEKEFKNRIGAKRRRRKKTRNEMN